MTPLTPNAYITSKILNALKAQPLTCMSRAELMDKAHISSRALLDQYIDSSIKYGRARMELEHIVTVYKSGYYYDPYPNNYREISSHGEHTVMEVINPALPHKSRHTILFGNFELDLGCYRLFLGRRFVNLNFQEAMTLKTFFHPESAGHVLHHERLITRLISDRKTSGKKNESGIRVFSPKRVRNVLEALAGPKARGIIRCLRKVGFIADRKLAESLFPLAATECNGSSARPRAQPKPRKAPKRRSGRHYRLGSNPARRSEL